ncbi:hypothetical protein BDN72DRAFT_898422 [Pluteus cervinus]|uniref:Uncharacterized protein n=1 Tax=Pluteus cervinus TaxID=181527 RepID=A0ACD3ARA6_9AGAR|nr:hypothetical protein BDN72DRAFT_898422 [Pluteus cervinus]
MDDQAVVFYTANCARLFFRGTVKIVSSDLEFPSQSQLDKHHRHQPVLWSLIDCDTLKAPTPPFVTPDILFAIQASSPNLEQSAIWTKQRQAHKWGLDDWSMADLAAGLSCHYRGFLEQLERFFEASPDKRFLNREPAFNEAWKIVQTDGASLIGTNLEFYGNAPRDAYAAIFKPQGCEMALSAALKATTHENLVNCLFRAPRPDFSGVDSFISHTLLAVSVKHHGVIDTFTPRFKSDVIQQIVSEHVYCSRQTRNIIELLVIIYRMVLKFSALAGWIYRELVHAALSGQEQNQLPLGCLKPTLRESGSTSYVYKAQRPSQSRPPPFLLIHERLRVPVGTVLRTIESNFLVVTLTNLKTATTLSPSPPYLHSTPFLSKLFKTPTL